MNFKKNSLFVKNKTKLFSIFLYFYFLVFTQNEGRFESAFLLYKIIMICQIIQNLY